MRKYARRMTIFISARPSDLFTGHLSGLPNALVDLGHMDRLVVPHYRFSKQEEVAESNVQIEIVDVMASCGLDVRMGDLGEIAHFFRGSAERELVQSRLKKMLNRFDSTGTFRQLDREALVFDAAIRTLALLKDRQPKAVVFLSTPHTFGEYLLFESAKFLEFRVLFFQPVPLAPAMIPYRDLGKRQKPTTGMSDQSPVSREILLRSKSKLASLLDGIQPAYISYQRARDSEARDIRGRLRTFRHISRWLVKPRFESSIDFSLTQERKSVLANFIRLYLNRQIMQELQRQAGSLATKVDANKFALFALHYEPERTSLPEGLPVEFQLEAVLKVRSMLPEDVLLAVKEHSSQVSPALRGHLGRSPKFYDIVASLPNTVMLSPHLDTKAEFSKISCVFTLTGTIALEAAAAGIPVGYFGTPWWEGMPGTQRISFDSQWSEFSKLRGPGRNTVEKFVQETLILNSVPGIASEDPEDYGRRNGPVTKSLLGQMAKSIALEINALIRG